jgi:hypothetical protein
MKESQHWNPSLRRLLPYGLLIDFPAEGKAFTNVFGYSIYISPCIHKPIGSHHTWPEEDPVASSMEMGHYFLLYKFINHFSLIRQVPFFSLFLVAPNFINCFSLEG